MRKFVAFAVVALFVYSPLALAVVVISSSGQVDNEDFNSFAGTALSVPANFSYSGTDYNPGGFYNLSGSYSNSNSTYALRANGLVDANERAFGSKVGASEGPFTLTWTFQNNTGSSLTDFAISWDVEQYSAAFRATTVDLRYSINAGPATQAGISGTTLTTASLGATDGANLSSIATTNRSVSLTLASPLLNTQQISFLWTWTSGAGSGNNAYIGVDNLSVTSTAVPESSAFMFAGLALSTSGLLTMRHCRRNRKATA